MSDGKIEWMHLPQTEYDSLWDTITTLRARVEELEKALQETLSKLESQVVRNPELPESYRQTVGDGFAVLRGKPNE